MATDQIVENEAPQQGRAQQVRRAGQAVKSHPKPVAAGALAAVGAVLAAVLYRRRAAKARATTRFGRLAGRFSR